jgi:membrane protein required for colicin V production
MNYIDLFVIVLLAYAVFKGVTTGLMLQASSLAALVLGIFAAVKLSGLTAELLSDRIDVNEELLFLISLAITFIAVFIVVNLIGHALDKFLKMIQLSFLNKFLGIIFSTFKMAVILGIIFAFADRLDYKTSFLPEGTKERSFFFVPLASVARGIFPGLEYYRPDEDFTPVNAQKTVNPEFRAAPETVNSK